eukprot:scaffold39548_cov168-Amphora_coffeaeformis.AAC.1
MPAVAASLIVSPTLASTATSAATAEIVHLKPILDPYPVPSVGTVTIEKESPHDKIGIKFKLIHESVIRVDGLAPGSLVARTTMKVGQEILAINGHAVHGTRQVVDMIRDNRKLEFTTFDHTKHKQLSPFCYVEVAPTGRINPGISFDSCRSRSMVIVGDMFVSDLSKTRLRKGDIVLAVNGVPVWKPEVADEMQIQAARDAQALVLYCVDMDALRDHFHVYVDKQQDLPGNNTRHAYIKKVDANTIQILERECRAVAKIDLETQLYRDETEWQMRLKSVGDKDLQVKKSYQVCSKTIDAINQLLEDQLLVVKAKIVGQAWHASLKKSEAEIPTYTIPTAPSLPMEIG